MALTKIIGSGIGTVTNQFSDANMSAGSVVQVVTVQNGAVATTTTQMVFDDTIPQNTEGGEFMTLAITPTNSSNTLLIETELNLDTSVTQYMVVALFQDDTANAISAGYLHMGGVEESKRIHLKFKMTAGTTSATTFKVRAGIPASGTTTFNGTNTSRRMGGLLNSYMQITEIAV